MAGGESRSRVSIPAARACSYEASARTGNALGGLGLELGRGPQGTELQHLDPADSLAHRLRGFAQRVAAQEPQLEHLAVVGGERVQNTLHPDRCVFGSYQLVAAPFVTDVVGQLSLGHARPVRPE